VSLLTTTSKIALVCSNKPRPSVQSNRGYKNIKTGQSVWGRDVYHAALAEDKKRTLCNVDSSEWLTINPEVNAEEMQTALDDFHFCTRCRTKLMDIPA
jgi:hypothetical protein